MRVITLFFLCALLYTSCQAQAILFCDNLKPDTSSCAKVLSSALKSKKNKLYYKNTPLEICSLDGAYNISFGISELYKKAGFQLNCEDIARLKPFNNKKYGTKYGLWFKVTPLGRVRSVIQYDSGRVRSIITFWPDGLPQRFTKYKISGKPVEGSNEFYKKQ